MDRRRGNIVVSRRTVLEESRAEQRSEIVRTSKRVRWSRRGRITDYGAFVDLGGIDGLLHVTDMAWRRVNHPTEISTSARRSRCRISINRNPPHRSA